MSPTVLPAGQTVPRNGRRRTRFAGKSPFVAGTRFDVGVLSRAESTGCVQLRQALANAVSRRKSGDFARLSMRSSETGARTPVAVPDAEDQMVKKLAPLALAAALLG